MSQRKCCFYKGCTSKQILGGAPSDITFFQFPRDPERCKLWQKLSCCENTDAPVKYLCSKHFDERKYISKNPRRLLLLANAVPYQYESGGDDNVDEIDDDECQLEEEQIVTSQFTDEDYLMHSVDVSEFSEPECHAVAESTINDVEYVQQEPRQSKSYENSHKKAKWEPTIEHASPFKIVKTETTKYEGASSSGTPVKKACAQENVTLEKNKEQSSVALCDEIIDNPNITTFIFKGEEYIQMPKRVYLQEKNELLEKLQYYKDIVASIKTQINDVQI